MDCIIGTASAQLLASLSRRHSVAVLYLKGRFELPADPVLQQNCDLVEEVLRPESPKRPNGTAVLPNLEMWKSLLRGRPRWVNDVSVPSYAAHVEQIAQSWEPDIVQMEFHVMAQYQWVITNCPAPQILARYDPGVKQRGTLPIRSAGRPFFAIP